jgi:hypothetical protein
VLEDELEVAWGNITENAARWRALRDEARHRAHQGLSEVMMEMIKRRLPPIGNRKLNVD